MPIPKPYGKRTNKRESDPQRCKDLNLGLILLEAKAINTDPGIILAMRRANWIRQELYEWIRSYEERNGEIGKALFRRDWSFFRTWVPLQIRLAVEQIIWNSFEEYRDLVSGFNPIGKARGTQGNVAGPRAQDRSPRGYVGETSERGIGGEMSDQELLARLAIARRNPPP